jgi:DnaK suppressor protein
MLTKKKKDKFRKLLTERLNELLSEANRTVSGMTDQGDNFPDPTDRATLESDRNFLLRIRDRERRLIAKINAALERIEEGTFGICEECGEEISEARLKARPVTTLCIDCKKKQENVERVKGL